MIVRSIRVEGWRCFAAPVEVGPFGEGLNVVYGPNGVGKSTVMMALVRALFDSHKVGGDEVKALRPWGRSLNPKVTVEFQKNGSRYRLHKQFLSAPSAHLSRLEKSQFVPVAESLAADEQARQILSGDASLRGVTKQQHWGLAQILWATQGDLELHALSPGTRATITDALGGQLSGPAVETIETRIAEAYQRFYTPTGQLRGGASAPAIVGLRSEREAADVERAVLLRRLAEFEAASRRIDDLRSRTNQAKQSEHELTETVKGAREQAQIYKDVLAQQKLHQQEVSSAEDRYATLKTRVDAITTTRAELALPSKSSHGSRKICRLRPDRSFNAATTWTGQSWHSRTCDRVVRRFRRPGTLPKWHNDSSRPAWNERVWTTHWNKSGRRIRSEMSCANNDHA